MSKQPRQNRTDGEYLKAMQDFAIGQWPNALREAVVLYSIPNLSKDEKGYETKLAARLKVKSGMIQHLTWLSRAASCNVHPTGSNNEDEKNLQTQLMAEAMKHLNQTQSMANGDE